MTGKVLARILLNRLVPSIAKEHLPESQCGFRANRSTTDMVIILRQLQEKCHEQNKGMYATFIDLKKAFDTVRWKGLWQILERLGCPGKFLNMVIQLHKDQRGKIRLKGDLSEPFPISKNLSRSWSTRIDVTTRNGREVSEIIKFRKGLPQGDALCPRLFTVCLKLKAWKISESEGYRLSKPIGATVTDLLYIEDLKIFAASESKLSSVTSRGGSAGWLTA